MLPYGIRTLCNLAIDGSVTLGMNFMQFGPIWVSNTGNTTKIEELILSESQVKTQNACMLQLWIA
jgi:hypothetical protein